MLRCTKCKKTIIKDTKYMNWLELLNFTNHQYLNENISLSLRDHLVDYLMTFKEFAYEENVVQVKNKNKISYIKIDIEELRVLSTSDEEFEGIKVIK